MKNMHIIQFLVLLMTLFALEKNVVGQKSLWTFNRAVEMWQSKSCIFPDKSLYTTGPLNVMPKLDQCRLLENRNASGSPDDILCEAFYNLSSTLCGVQWQLFVQKCLNPELVEKSNVFAKQGVCSYIFGNDNVSSFFTFLPTGELCQRICEFSISPMKPVCELYALIIYRYKHPETCGTSEKQPQEEKDKTVIVEDPNKGEKSTSVTQELLTTPSTVTETKSTSPTQLKGLTSENATLKQEHPETVKSSESSSTADDDIKSTSTVNGTQLDEASELGKNGLKASFIKSTPTAQGTLQPVDTSALKKEGSNTASNDITSTVNKTLPPIEASAPRDDSKASAPKKNELELPSLLISKITSAAAAGIEDTETTTPQEDESTTTTESTTPEDVEGNDGNSDIDEDDSEDFAVVDDPRNESSWGQSDDGKTVVDKTKNKTPGDKTGVSKVKLPEEIETGKKQSQNTLENIENPAGAVYDDSESSPGSGHFLAYFLTAVVICISGYVIYHNKQKILAFIIEGRHSGRGGRQRSKDVKYSQLKSNVEEVMPSLEQTATGKNFVY